MSSRPASRLESLPATAASPLPNSTSGGLFVNPNEGLLGTLMSYDGIGTHGLVHEFRALHSERPPARGHMTLSGFGVSYQQLWTTLSSHPPSRTGELFRVIYHEQSWNLGIHQHRSCIVLKGSEAPHISFTLSKLTAELSEQPAKGRSQIRVQAM